MSTIIEGKFSLYKNSFFTYDVKLDLDFLSYTPNSSKADHNAAVIQSVKDIIGCALMKSNSAETKDKVYITIYSYPMVNGRKKRKRKTITFEIFSEKTYEENLQIAHTWKKLLYHAIYHSKDNDGTSLPLFKFQKSLLILLNPKSGPGIALEIFEQKVKPLLLEAEVTYDIIITDHANHAYELVQHKDLQQYTGIVIVAGDGLIYEVYNGLLQRSDSDTALTIPIGVIPGGSGNGLASSVSHLLNEPYLSNPALVSTLNIVNPVVTPLDLVLLQTHKGHKLVSFLSIGFGIISDIDIESERLRRLGEVRFTIYGVARVFYLRKYSARLSYKVAQNVEVNSPTMKRQRPFLLRSHTVQEDIANGGEQDVKNSLPIRPRSMIFDDNEDVVTPTELGSDLLLEQINDMKEDEKEKKSMKITTVWDSPTDKFRVEGENILNNPVPSDWETIEDDFVSIYAVNVPYIGSDRYISPKSTLDDGVMWLCYIRGNVSRAILTKFLLSMDSGIHTDLPSVTYVPITDMRIVPLCSSGKITVDGELIELGPIQATVLPKKGRIMVRRN